VTNPDPAAYAYVELRGEDTTHRLQVPQTPQVEVIAPGAFGDQPKVVPVTFGVGGPVVGVATVHEDGTADLRIGEEDDG
jgi:hypothetical protein